MKYMSLPNTPNRTYNIKAIHQAARGVGGDSSIHICEGEFDAMILGQIGLHAIAVPGAKSWRPHHTKMLAGFNEIYVWADPDEAGMELAEKITRSLRNAVVVRLTLGDVSETFVQVKQEGMMALLNGEG